MHIEVLFHHRQEELWFFIEVLPSTTFIEAKESIEEHHGAKVARQSLWRDGLELKDDYDFEFYEFTEGMVIELYYELLPDGQTFTIYAYTPTEEEYSLEVEETITVFDLKEKIEEVADICVEHMKLYCKMWWDLIDVCELSAYFISEGSKIIVEY